MKLRRRLPAIPITIVLLGLVSACSWMPGKPKPEEGWKRWSEIKDFGELYSHNCSGCHGANGREGTAQQLNDPLYQRLVSDDTLRQVIRNGVPATSMPAFVDTAGGSLTAEQIDVLVVGMRSQWARPQQFDNVDLPPYSLQDATAKGSGSGNPQRGADSYKTYCAQCHGEGGRGGDKAGSIVDQNYLAVVSDQSLRTIVITGRPDLKKPDWRSNVSGQAMTAQEISDVVAWLVSLRQGTETRAPSEVKVASAVGHRKVNETMCSHGSASHENNHSMSSRRKFLLKVGAGLNVIAASLVAVPLIGYVFSSFRRKEPYQSWISLGAIQHFPEQSTRLAKYRNPFTRPWDGSTGDIPCWVRRIESEKFQVFAVNCTHLGCPVRWFQQSRLFMCPCHGGAFYEDGSHAAGPPPRGLFEYEYKVENGELLVRGGRLPTLSESL